MVPRMMFWLPRLNCRGLIEAQPRTVALAPHWDNFRGLIAAASLKLLVDAGKERSVCDFRGLIAAASLKQCLRGDNRADGHRASAA